MACYYPRPAWQRADKTIAFQATPDALRELTVPCGQCIGCRIAHAKQWSVRCMHESQLHQDNCFLTLTYDDAHLPQYGALQYEDFQAFLRSLRQAVRPQKIRYFVAGEYGTQLQRPHWHALLFGYRPPDLVPTRALGKNSLFLSETMLKHWGKGHITVGELTPATANYVAKYTLKKISGEAGELHYRRLDPSTGELVKVPPEMARMSLKPGIGAHWYAKYRQELHTHDAAIVEGRKAQIPRYYDKLTKKLDAETYEATEYKRYEKALDRLDEQTPERLAAREAVQRAKLALSPRKL